jgi:glycerophosphoryl diester phosphodiesterase
MANLQPIDGNDFLINQWPKLDQNTRAVNDELGQHKASTAAHDAESITYSGAVAGASDVKDAIDAVKNELNNAIITGDSGPEAAAARVDPITGTTYPTLGDRLNTETEILMTSANKIFELIGRTGINKFIAHRGAMDLYPENTLIALERSCISGYFGIEFDVWETADGAWIVMHDDTVDRTTNGTGAISSLTLAQIKELIVDAGANIALYPGLKVPTLEEVLRMCVKYKTIPCIEIKASTMTGYDTFISLVRQFGLEDKCAVVSFYRNILQEIRKRSRKIALMLNENISNDSIAWLKKMGNGIISTPYDYATKTLVAEAHQNGVAVVTYSINTVSAAYAQLDLGVDLMTTNRLI